MLKERRLGCSNMRVHAMESKASEGGEQREARLDQRRVHDYGAPYVKEIHKIVHVDIY